MKVVDIPGGQATLREKQDVKVRQRRLIEAAAIAAAPLLAKLPQDTDARQGLSEADVLDLGISRKEAESLFELQDATIVAVLAGWTLPIPLPDMDTIADLDPDVYDTLKDVTANIGAEVTGETFEAPSPQSADFEASPTEPSADSSNGSEGTERSELTTAPQSSGVSTNSEPSSSD